jgi:hypothetical protein
MTTAAATSPRFYLVKRTVPIGTCARSGITYTADKHKQAGKAGYLIKVDDDGDLTLSFVGGAQWFFAPDWVTPVAREHEAGDVPLAARLCFLSADTSAALPRGTFVRIKCLYTAAQRRAALVGVADPSWIDCMDASMGQIGVIMDRHSSGSCNVRYMCLHSAHTKCHIFNQGWLTVIADVALEVPRATAAALEYPLPAATAGADTDAADKKRKHVDEVVDELERVKRSVENTIAKLRE